MSLVNFTVTAVPIMCVFILFAAIIDAPPLNDKPKIAFSIYPKYFFGSALILVGLFTFYKNTAYANSLIKVTTAINFAREKRYNEASQVLNKIPSGFQNNQNYLQTLGSLQYVQNKKDEALNTFQEKAVLVYSTPLLYELIGDCYFTQKNYIKAVENFTIAKNIQPNRFTPLYYLFRLYASINDKSNTLKYANTIANMEEKVPSLKTRKIKKIAADYLIKVKTIYDNKIN